MTQTYYIFRHGLATHSTTGYGADILTAEVLPEGIPTVQRLAQILKAVESDYNVCSPFIRCRQTAAIVTEAHGMPFETDDRIREYHDETFDAMKERVKEFVDDLQSRPYQRVMICSHGMIIAAMTNFITKGSFSRENQLDYPPPGELFIIQGGEVEKVSP